MIVYNSGQEFDSLDLTKVADYEVYDLGTGCLLRSYHLFNKVEFKTEDPDYPAKTFLSQRDCIRPDGKKIAFGMNFMPQINILDIETGEAKGFSLKGRKEFSTKHKIWHFASLQADDDCIYALYYGKDLVYFDDNAFPDQLYVFDWDGKPMKRFKLDKPFSGIHIDGSMLYFSHANRDELYAVPTDRLKE